MLANSFRRAALGLEREVSALARWHQAPAATAALAAPKWAAAASRLLSTRASAPPKGSAGESVPVGARPSLCVMVTGRHRANGLNDVTSLLAERGASIFSAKRIKVEGQFCAMFAVWLPGGGKVNSRQFGQELERGRASEPRLQGFNVQIFDVDQGAGGGAGEGKTSEPEMRRLRVLCPQKPGLLNAITSILLDHECVISQLEADTATAVSDEVMFRMDAVVELPREPAAEALEAELEAWADSESSWLRFKPTEDREGGQ